MIVALPKDCDERKRALEWLNAKGVAHLKLFQAVQINADADAGRFKDWLRETAA